MLCGAANKLNFTSVNPSIIISAIADLHKSLINTSKSEVLHMIEHIQIDTLYCKRENNIPVADMFQTLFKGAALSICIG
jgi:hypothetical protein